MTLLSYTGLINTKEEFKNIETLTGKTFTQGNKYLIQTNALTIVKVEDAEIEVSDQKPYIYVANGTPVSIKTDFCGCKLTILENN